MESESASETLVESKLKESKGNFSPKHLLTCPFCCDEYLFDFSMKDHLKKYHSEEIEKLDSWPVEHHFCPYCLAAFYYPSLIPKHIYFAHGKETLDEHFSTDDNLKKYQIEKENINEPSIKFLDCSPGLSELFNDLDTCDSIKKFKLGSNSVTTTPVSQPRSILKKTPYSGKFGVILSPESVALRRTIKTLKRTASARRELRFDLPPIQLSPEAKDSSAALPPLNFDEKAPKKKFWNFFGTRRSPPPINSKIKKKIRAKACKMSNRSANQMITSTPMAYLDDSDSGCDELDQSIGSNWKTALKTSNFCPLFLTAERFQCNFCQAKFSHNAELLSHQKTTHRRRISLLPSFRCGQCSSTFYRNCYLERHCNRQHTPSKN